MPMQFFELPKSLRFYKGEYGPERSEVQVNHQVWCPWADKPWKEAHAKKGKSTKPGWWLPCNCQGGRTDIPCVPHWYANPENQSKLPPDLRGKEFNLFSSAAVAINVLDMFPYHKVPWQFGERRGVSLRRCWGNDDCPHCKADLETTFGNKDFVNLFNKQWHEFLTWDQKVRRICPDCLEGRAVPTASNCTSCGKGVEVNAETMLKMEEEMWQCPHCHREVTMSLTYECKVRDRAAAKWKEGCGATITPDNLLSIWAVDVDIKKVPIGTQFELHMDEWAVAPLEEALLEKCKPMDFEFLMYMEPEDQAKIMKLPNPYSADFSGGKTETKPEDSTPEPEPEGDGGIDVDDDSFPF
jgi:hypothetical protein